MRSKLFLILIVVGVIALVSDIGFAIYAGLTFSALKAMEITMGPDLYNILSYVVIALNGALLIVSLAYLISYKRGK